MTDIFTDEAPESTGTPAELSEAEINEKFEALSDVSKSMLSELKKYIVEHNEIQSRISAATLDRNSLLKSLASESNDPEIKELEAQIEEIEDRINELLSAQADQMIASSSQTLEPDKLRIKDVDVAIRGGKQFLSSVNPSIDIEIFLPAVKGKTKGAGTRSGQGEGTRKIKGIEVYVDGTKAVLLDAKKIPRSSLSAAAKVLGVKVPALQASLFEAAGTDDPSKFEYPVEFVAADKDGADHKVQVRKAG